MKSKDLIWLLLLIPALALMGCEGDPGPAGPAGVDGTDGTDGANGTSVASCLECHADAGALDLLPIYLEYMQSGHRAGAYVAYAGGRAACAQCHGKQGFIEYAALGSVSADIPDPAAIDCATCHTVHPDTFGLRAAGGVALAGVAGYTVDFGNSSNLCANCHQSRRPEPNTDVPGATFAITSTHYGPHHGPQANVLEGVGFAEIAGSTAYPAPTTDNPHLSDTGACVGCHMGTGAEGLGGHTWKPIACTECHTAAPTSFQDGIATKLDTLRDMLIARGVVEYVAADEAYEPVVGTYPMVEAQAFFNWIGLAEDRSLGVHNPAYVSALLDNTIEALSD